MRLVEQADGLIQSAQDLYKQHKHIMGHEECMFAEERMN
jgi:hypothetical protein